MKRSSDTPSNQTELPFAADTPAHRTVRRLPQSAELPEGLVYLSDFLDESEHRALIKHVEALEFHPFEFQGYKAKRRIVEYGFEYDFSTRKASPAGSIPDFLVPIRERAAKFANLGASELTEALVTEYPAGAAIGWHRDVPQFEIVIGISLGSSCRMRFKPMKGGQISWLELAPGSSYLLRGAARWQYQHSIPAVKELRYSITFRSLRKKEKS
ncbi:MAG: alpha-ketoglutarate-dependent dioxygenase AlkB [Acidobacteria bacterium]|nr:alpha-ketoglutarate-dependent dioxygenase AlkB [Acidobacteriota bacterium]